MALLVVDMQDYFKSSALCLNEVCKAVKKAISKRKDIVFLEYEGCGGTSKAIKSLLKDYDKVAYRKKCNDAGGREALDGFASLGADVNKIQICGVNICYCVKDTAAEIKTLSPSTTIYMYKTQVACSCISKLYCLDMLKRFVYVRGINL